MSGEAGNHDAGTHLLRQVHQAGLKAGRSAYGSSGRQHMRRLVVVLFVALMALAALSGCGGGGGEEAAAPATPAAPAPSTAPVIPGAVGSAGDPPVSIEPSVTFAPFSDASVMPTAVAERARARTPMLLLFVDGSQQVTNEARAEAEAIAKSNNGLLDLLVYDLGKYASIDSSAQARVDAAGLSANGALAAAAVLAHDLGAVTTPYFVLIDDQAHVIFAQSGLVDRTLLSQQAQRIGD